MRAVCRPPPLARSPRDKLPVQQRDVGFCFQHYAAFKHMTVGDNVAFGLKIRKHERKAARPLRAPGDGVRDDFIGPVARLGVRFVRPHDVEISHGRNDGSEEALIERIVHLGFETRVETALSDGSQFWVQLTKLDSDLLELREGERRWRRG
ncbi:MAG: hypothetical protein H0W09_07940 [Solirubrobacterales bacterium]|nr:hypothetical protein [Solirubrobacterales bacterium]